MRSSETLGEPQTWAVGVRTAVLPAATSPAASFRWMARSVGSWLPYSTLTFANPDSPSGIPKLPATEVAFPWPPQLRSEPSRNSSPSKCRPCLTCTDPPERSFFSWKFSTPAMASEPYCAEAPSRSTSTCRSAMPGMAPMSGPWAPSESPPPSQVITAPRCRRLPLMSTSVWSDARPRRLAGREIVAASLIGWMFTLYEGTTLRSRKSILVSACREISDTGITSTGTIDSVTVRGLVRLPTTTSSFSSNAAIPSAISRVTDCPEATVTSWVCSPYPRSRTSRVWVPAGTPVIEKVPVAPVYSTRPRAGISTRAFPSPIALSPLRTVPSIVPWARAVAGMANRARIISPRLIIGVVSLGCSTRYVRHTPSPTRSVTDEKRHRR